MRIAILVLGCLLFLASIASAQNLGHVEAEAELIGAKALRLDIGTLLQNARNLEAGEGAGLREVIAALGIPPNFSVKVAQMPRTNAAAAFYARNRYLFIDEKFIAELDASVENWRAAAVVAHEVGHHLSGHTLVPAGSQHKLELEADQFAGHILAYLGVDLDEMLFEVAPFLDEAATETHPSREDRVAAFTQGWRNGAAALSHAQESTLCREMLKVLQISEQAWKDWTRECQDPERIKTFIQSWGNKIVRMLSLLLQLGHDPNVQDDDGNTFFHFAVSSFYCDGIADKVNVLMAYGADPSIKNYKGETPISLLWGNGCLWLDNQNFLDAAYTNHIAVSIINSTLATRDRGTGYRWFNYFKVAKSGTPSDLEPYIALQYPEKFADDDGNTAMHLAAINCNAALFEGMVNGALAEYPYQIPARISNNAGLKPHELAKRCKDISSEVISRVEFQSSG